MNRDELTLLAAICQKYGTKISGGYEIFIPLELLGGVSAQGVVQVPPDHDKPGVRLQYHFIGQTIDGGVAQITPIEPEGTKEPEQLVS